MYFYILGINVLHFNFWIMRFFAKALFVCVGLLLLLMEWLQHTLSVYMTTRGSPKIRISGNTHRYKIIIKNDIYTSVLYVKMLQIKLHNLLNYQDQLKPDTNLHNKLPETKGYQRNPKGNLWKLLQMAGTFWYCLLLNISFLNMLYRWILVCWRTPIRQQRLWGASVC